MVTREDTEEQAHQLPTGEVAFKAVGVKKHYPGVKALDGVDLEGYAGSVLGVCGANGAGNRPSRNCSRGWRLRRTGRSPSPVIRIRCATPPRRSRPEC
jgi:ABC-type branched-subunit amino acid transport system ATPase component